MQLSSNSYWEKQYWRDFDFIVVGGGLVGLSCAASLAEKKPENRILVLERGLLPTGASTKNAGFACFGSLTELLADLQRNDEDSCLQTVERRWCGLKKLRQRLGDQKIGFEASGGYELLLPKHQSALEQMAYINQLLHPIFGEEVFRSANHLLPVFGFQRVSHLLYNPFEGKVNTGMLTRSLLAYVQQLGVTVLTGAEVLHIEELRGRDCVQVHVKQSHTAEPFVFEAPRIAICSNAFSRQLLPSLPVAPGRGQVLITRPLPSLPFRGIFHFDEGYYYFRDIDGRLLFGGGRNLDFEGETTTELTPTEFIYKQLVKKLQEIILPSISFEIEYIWAGIMAFTPNHQPIVQRISPGIVAGVGLNGMGVAIGTEVGEQVAELLHS
ncbi:glycine/D-amino acid oxidase-like deaminating enzyme [Thermonema lapsum]|uniref:Glycine/D-amino acid oxidase-like deaminating enzyme n=1 Tax=Thermonema lapsum TaxID=28195 RepID=A0A846MQ51_9BACT|nr:FAD-dependent oxidoreductase [Thermonema lapsum]NIK73716.1 glycine/D-amino acid oxidase-like deaminating enzyme [Thermonema lapsum]